MDEGAMLLMAVTFIILYVIVGCAQWGYLSEVATKAGYNPIIYMLVESFNILQLDFQF